MSECRLEAVEFNDNRTFFNAWTEELCASCFAAKGRPSCYPVSPSGCCLSDTWNVSFPTGPLPGIVRTGSPRVFLGIPLHELTPEHVIDLFSGAMLATEIHLGDCGDTVCIENTLAAAQQNLDALDEDEPPEILCAVADKGYHQAELIRTLAQDQGFTTCTPERDASKRLRRHRHKDVCRKFHANRRCSRSSASKQRICLRSWLAERSFVHLERSVAPWKKRRSASDRVFHSVLCVL